MRRNWVVKKSIKSRKRKKITWTAYYTYRCLFGSRDNEHIAYGETVVLYVRVKVSADTSCAYTEIVLHRLG